MDKKRFDLTDKVLNDNSKDNINPEKTENKDPNYWRSFRELYNDPEFLKENDPVTSQDAHLESNDMLDSNQYIFKIQRVT